MTQKSIPTPRSSPMTPTSTTASSTSSPTRPTTPTRGPSSTSSTTSTVIARLPLTPSTPSALTDRLTAKLQDVRTNLVENIERSWYLGENTGRENVEWYRLGREDLLLTKASAQAFDDALKEFASSDDRCANPTPTPEPDHALLSAVVTITPEDFWMMSCGRWKGPTTVCREFADMKLTCTGAAPSDSVFQRDFPAVLANLNHLMALSSTRGFSLKKGLIVPRGTTHKVKFRHILFEPCTSESSSSDEGDFDGEDTPEEFRIQNWPAINDEAKWALENMHNTHRVLPLPAYGLRGDLILPSQYKTELEGATVQVHFILRHWSIGARDGAAGTDTYVADVMSMRVLVPPKPQASPVKRKLFGKDPMSGGPSKKTQV